VVQGVDSSNGYTFTGGDLAGLTVKNGNFMVWAADGWSIIATGMDPNLYYKLDGSLGLTGPFAAGGQQLKNVSDGTDIQDAITVYQLNTHTHSFEPELGNPTADDYVLSSKVSGARSWVPPWILPAINKIISGIDVKAICYHKVAWDDDPDWIEKCDGTSWFNEPLNTPTRGKTRKFPAEFLVVTENNFTTFT
jgi:hypothetical protein